MFLSHPSMFITASDPKIFGNDEIVIRDQSTGTDYIGGVPFSDPAHFPNVDVYAELPSNPDVLARLVANANAPRSHCSHHGDDENDWSGVVRVAH